MTLLRIGDMARLGGVSIRMLRHYHEVGLLVPVEVDEFTGYRSYDAGQLPRLRQLVTLRDIGLGLAEIDDALIDDERFATALERHLGVLEGERDEIDRRLGQLRQLMQRRHEEHTVTNPAELDFEIKEIPSRLVAQLTAIAPSWAPSDIGPTIQPLYPELIRRMELAGVAIAGPSTAWYEDTDDGQIAVHATLTIAERPGRDVDFEVLELPGIQVAGCALHVGSMDNCDDTYQALLTRLDREGWRALGYSRELDVQCEPDKPWITELQLPVERAV